MTKVNPSHLGKTALLVSKENQEARIQAARYLPGIKEGIRHLHSLGYVHNDLNPSNIMITEDDMPVIIDFDAATPPGAALDQVKRTYGWFDPETLVAQARIACLAVWLSSRAISIQGVRQRLTGRAGHMRMPRQSEERTSRQTVENSRVLHPQIPKFLTVSKHG